MSQQIYNFDKNTVLMASAGTGKTHALVHLYLHLISGLTQSRDTPLHPKKIVVITFTDKAATELKERIAKHIHQLSIGKENDDLVSSARKLGRPIPDTHFWMNLKQEYRLSSISTFHSFAAKILREFGPLIGVSPEFNIIAPDHIQAKIKYYIDEIILQSIQIRDPAFTEFSSWHPLFEKNQQGTSLSSSLYSMYQIIHDGSVHFTAETLNRYYHKDKIINAWIQIKKELIQNLHDLSAQIRQHDLTKSFTDKAYCALSRLKDIERYELEDNHFGEASAEYLSQLLTDLHSLKGNKPKQYKETAQMIIDVSDMFISKIFDYHSCKYVSLIADLLQKVHAISSDYKIRNNVLEYSDLITLALSLLNNSEVIVNELSKRHEVFLIDEFQDTNLSQMRLVDSITRLNLSETPVCEISSTEPKLFVVGDLKQAIYEFRGGDTRLISMLSQLEKTRSDFRTLYLQNNYRSENTLINFYNHFFSTIKGSSTFSFYNPNHDNLQAAASRNKYLDYYPSVHVIEMQNDKNEQDEFEPESEQDFSEAKAICEHILFLKEQNLSFQFQDIAILFQKFTYISWYRLALSRYNIPFEIVAERAFFNTQEVWDIAAILLVLMKTDHQLAWLTLLRSPLISLSDNFLFSLFRLHKNEPFTLQNLRTCLNDQNLSEHFSSDLNSLRTFLIQYDMLRKNIISHRTMSISQLLERFIYLRGYLDIIRPFPDFFQRLENIQKTFTIILQKENEGMNLAGIALYFENAIDREIEEELPKIKTQQSNTVKLLTVHKAKGLQWPVVIIPRMQSQENHNTYPIVYLADHGIVFKHPLQNKYKKNSELSATIYKQVYDELNEKRNRENERLLYVALTRAQQYLLLSFTQPKKQSSNTWKRYLQTYLDGVTKIDNEQQVAIFKHNFSALYHCHGHDVNGSFYISCDKKDSHSFLSTMPDDVPELASIHFTRSYLPKMMTFIPTHRFSVHEATDRILEQKQEGITEENDSDNNLTLLTLGNILHAFFEGFSFSENFSTHTIEKTLQNLAVHISQKDRVYLKEQIIKFIQSDFYKKNIISSDVLSLGQEIPITVNIIDNIQIDGTADLVIKKENQIIIADYKFSRPSSFISPRHEFQLMCYLLGVFQRCDDAVQQFFQNDRFIFSYALIAFHPFQKVIMKDVSYEELINFKARLIQKCTHTDIKIEKSGHQGSDRILVKG